MIDADGHVIEQLHLPQEILDAFMNRVIGDVPPSREDPAPMEASHAEVMHRRGASEPGPRLEDMDADGIDVAVL
jgi:hypothetical protein